MATIGSARAHQAGPVAARNAARMQHRKWAIARVGGQGCDWYDCIFNISILQPAFIQPEPTSAEQSSTSISCTDAPISSLRFLSLSLLCLTERSGGQMAALPMRHARCTEGTPCVALSINQWPALETTCCSCPWKPQAPGQGSLESCRTGVVYCGDVELHSNPEVA